MFGVLVVLAYVVAIVLVIAALVTIIRFSVKLALRDHAEYRDNLAWARRHVCPECGAPPGQGCIRQGRNVPDPVLRHAGRIALDNKIASVTP